ncbi:MAG: hypothetical protein AB2A00_27020 [Myxococcota bacterium]
MELVFSTARSSLGTNPPTLTDDLLTAQHRSPEVDTLAAQIHRRLVRWCQRRGLFKQNDGNVQEQLDALGACGRAALAQGTRERRGPA